MSAGAQDYLYEALSQRFEDGTRKAVLVLGAGLHHHLRGLSRGTEAEWSPFTNWIGLLASVAEMFGLPEVRHDDPVSTWESLIARATLYAHTESAGAGGSSPASGVDSKSRHELARRLHPVPMHADAALVLGHGVTAYRDVISLNIDDACSEAARHSAVIAHASTPHDLQNLLPTWLWQRQQAHGRIWQPHGTRSAPEHIVLSARAYGRVMSKLQPAWDHAKQAERLWAGGKLKAGGWTPEDAARWWNERRAVVPYEPEVQHAERVRLTWLDLFLGSDLVFLGTSLDRAETDIWWALHMRQRNLARVPPSVRPRAFVLFEKEVPHHLQTGPAGITPVLFASWSEAWRMVL